MSPGAPAPQSPGHLRYRVLDEILRSGTECILRARDNDLNREVLVAFCGGGSAAARSAFERRGRIVGSLATQFVVDVYDGGRDEGRPYIVFERLTRSLTDVFAVGAPTHEVLVKWAGELREAVSSLRVAGVEFGMLRPELVGITEAGHIRLSPWPLRSEEADWWTPTTSAASDLEQIAALLGPAAVEMSRPPVLQEGSAGAVEILSPTLLSASGAHTEAVPQATMETSEPTAPVLIGPWMPTRGKDGRLSRHRALYGGGAAAAIVIVAAIALAGSLFGQAPAKGTPTHQGAVGTRHSTVVAPPAGAARSDSSLQEPASIGTTAQPPTTQATTPATTIPPASVVTPASSATATGSSAASDPTTTSTTTPPATTTTTQSPSTTTTTTSPPANAPGSVSTSADAGGPPAPG